MPRKPPPPGLITAGEAAKILGVSTGMLSIYVKQGKLHREGPSSRIYKFYVESEVRALSETEKAFFEAGEKPQRYLKSFFAQATADDLQAIIDIDVRTFHEPVNEGTYRRWMQKNPEVFFVLQDAKKQDVGFACYLPVKEETLHKFVQDEVTMDDIPLEDIELFEPGKPLHLYVIALCIDPAFTSAVKRSYGASLVRGTFSFLLNLARRGVEIETITARSFTADGIRLMRHLGIPQLRSPVPIKKLFEVRVAESGFPILEHYTQLLDEWKQEHQQVID